MTEGRPWRSVASLLEGAERAWRGAEPADWDEAFAHHPRIGEHGSARRVSAAAADWSAGEQAGVSAADSAARRALAEGNAEYERRFGRIYIVCASGLTAMEMLDDLRTRVASDPVTEHRRAAAEQRKITMLRLRKLLGAEET